LAIAAMSYWGLLLLPALIARNVVVACKQDSNAIVRAGFRSPSRFATAMLSAAVAVERRLPPTPIGTSLLAIARKPG